MKQESLCKSCDNRDTAYVYKGGKYVYELICIYDMANFPNMAKCVKYIPRQYEDDVECSGRS